MVPQRNYVDSATTEWFSPNFSKKPSGSRLQTKPVGMFRLRQGRRPLRRIEQYQKVHKISAIKQWEPCKSQGTRETRCAQPASINKGHTTQHWCLTVSTPVFQTGCTGSNPVCCSTALTEKRTLKAHTATYFANSLMDMTFSFQEKYMGSIPILQ